MARELKFELHAYTADAHGAVASKAEVFNETWPTESAARGRAGRLAKRVNGPVDLAYAYEAGEPAQDWADRYITTASPSEHHASGYRFERLS